jgi:hypothetical protein
LKKRRIVTRIGLGGGKDGSVLYLLPILSFVGGGIALSMPAAAAGLLGLVAVILLAIGGQFGYAINIITIGPVVLNGVGALRAFIAYQAGIKEDLTVAVAPQQGEASPAHVAALPSAAAQTQSTSQFDRAKWNALVKYDEDCAPADGRS